MKISLLTTWKTRCGIAEYSKNFTRALSSLGLDIRIVKLDAPQDMENILQQSNDADAAHVQFAPSFFKNYDFNNFMRSIKIPSIITMHEEYPAADFPRGVRALSPHYLGGYFYRIFLGKPYYSILKNLVSKFIVHSEDMKKFLTKFGVSKNKIELFPHPVPPPGKIYDKEKSKSELSLSGRIVLTIFGFINNRKGYELALQALRGLPEKYVLLIAGGGHTDDHGKYENKLKQNVKRLKLDSRVKFTGFLRDEQIPLIMSSTDIVLAPFTEMTNSGSLSVAIGYGKAVITSGLNPNRGIYEQGKCLELFKKGDFSGLRRAVVKLTDNASLKNQLEVNAKKYAENYSYRRMAEVLRGIYQRVLNEKENLK